MASTVSLAMNLRTAQGEHAAWRLLNATNAPAIISILDAHLGGDTRRIPVPDFVNLVDIDLDELRFRGNFNLSRTAEQYCEDWRAKGWLVRKPQAHSRVETYELSSGAYAAIHFAKGLVEPRRVTTQSRLSTIINQIDSLALEIDGNEQRRLQSLLEERDRIDRAIADLEEGRYEALDQAQALERARDIINLAQEIPGDFVRVRDDFESLNRQLYETILNSEEGHADILENIFSGVDYIAQSPSGQSFRGFFALLRDSELNETVQDNIDAMLANERLDELAPEERRMLRTLIRTFQERSHEVNEVKTELSHGLRRFVQSREYLADRELKRLIDATLAKAHAVTEAHSLTRGSLLELDLTTVPLSSIARYKLYNPADDRADSLDDADDVAEEQPLSLEELYALMRETEIDLGELKANVNDVWEQERARQGTTDAAVSIGAVLRHHPATQGVASVVGLLVLGFDQGRRIPDQTESVEWEGTDGRVRSAVIPAVAFFEKVV